MKQRRVTVRVGLCVLVVFALACSARGGGGGGPIDTDGSTTAPEDAAPSDASGSFVETFCAEHCARTRSTPGCSEIPATCEATCTNILSLPPPACRPQLDAVVSCYRSSPIVCTRPGESAVPTCSDRFTAIGLCAASMSDGGSDADSP